MDRDGLADFLRLRREALQPEDVGLTPTRRRRTAGLRREEVAQLAHMSTDFYARLEQRRGSRPSAETVAALARALRLTPVEADHLHDLAGHVPPPRRIRTREVSPGLARVLDRLDVPAQVVDDLGATLGQNAMADALRGDTSGLEGLRRSVFYRWFTEREERERWHPDDHELHSRNYAAALRAAAGRHPDDPEARELVDALLRDSAEFRELWARHEVAGRAHARKRFVHPLVGPLTLDCQVLTSEDGTESLLIFTAAPGTEDADRLRLLEVVGSQGF